MSESERVTLALRGAVNVVVGTFLVYAIFVVANKYRSRYPVLRVVDWMLTVAAGMGMLWGIPYLLSAWPLWTRTWLPLVAAIVVELLPRRYREKFWDDVGLRAIVIGACLFTISEILFAWWP